MMRYLLLILIISCLFALAWPKDKEEAKPQEPHYKNGEHNKDFHKETDDDDASVDKKAAKCPYVKESKSDGGCPYKNHQEIKATDCPSFKEGCPYADEKENLEKVKDCPAFKEGCPYKEGDKGEASLNDCPAFKEGCPYHKHEHKHYTHHGCPVLDTSDCPYLKGDKDIKKIANCPKFHEGCPFSEDQDALEKIKDCPKFKEGCPFITEDNVDFSQWKDCPAFKDGCPYDSVVTHSHATELKKIANNFLAAHLGSEKHDLSALVTPNFKATLKGAVSPKHRDIPLDTKTFLELTANIQNHVQWKISPVTSITEGHTVIIHSHLDGTFQPSSTDSAEFKDIYKGVVSKELKDVSLVSIFHFNEEQKVETFVSFFDLLSYSKQLGIKVQA